MGTSPNLSCSPFLNIDTGDELRRPCYALESALSPDPRHLAFVFAGLSSTSDFSVREVLALMSPPDAEDRLMFLDILTITDLGFLHTHGSSPCSNIKWGTTRDIRERPPPWLC
jgi:hypothetical protein